MEILQEKISEKHNDSFWYEGHIARAVTEKGTEIILIATGEIRIHNKEGDIVFDGKERNDGIEGGLNNDDDLEKIGNNYDDKYYWVNNNWFEVMFKKKGCENYDTIMGDVAHDYDEAMELFKKYLEEE